MKDGEKTRAQLIGELAYARQRIAELASGEAGHKQEEAQKTHEATFQNLLEFAPYGIVIVNGDGQIEIVNAQIEAMFAYDRDELIGSPVEILLPERFQDVHIENRRDYGSNPSLRPMGSGLDLTGRRRDGSEFPVDISLSPVETAEGLLVISIIVDITERKQTEQERVRLERLSALGEMARGVAHNFNNILGAVLGYAQLIQRKTADPEILEDASHIVKGALEAKKLAQHLIRAVRGGEQGTLHPVSVHEAVQGALHAVRPRWEDAAEAGGVSIDVVTHLEQLPPIVATHDGLFGILVNLLSNAVDALPDGGTITVDTQAVGEGVQLSVRDTGIGMDEETRKRVFEPFFTTKAKVGTGLGLSAVYSTVTHWGGSIDVKSAPGKGTTFTLRLPAWTGSELAQQEKNHKSIKRHDRPDRGVKSVQR